MINQNSTRMDFMAQLVGSVFLVFNKIYLVKKKSISWIIGILGVIIITPPIYQKGLWINLGYHAGLILLLLFGYYLAVSEENAMSKFWKIFLKSIVVFATLAFCIHLSIAAQSSLYFTNLQLVQCTSGLLAALFLAFDIRMTNILGWISFVVAHSFATAVYLSIDLVALALGQILSIVIAFWGIYEELKQKKPVIV